MQHAVRQGPKRRPIDDGADRGDHIEGDHVETDQGSGDGGDVRATARASLAAGRTPSLWWTCAGLAVSLALTLTWGVPVGGLALAAGLAAAGIARAVMPAPGPVAFTVRSRALDVSILLLLAVGVGVLSQLIPVR